ncbi:unnamed protein product [Peronospora farinosa]|uniref:HSF-type DNA-binding domain-containing protein n=1 Tax=Peronospora farinosa TaxID=134698 RepID=A0AAV0SQZ3_9STRA|nr:unnamed protein product [Peronospora farinosa]CAI5706146.1 unnamed protein product [Peronospora farinosa]
MPSAKTARPTTDSSRSESSKRLRLSPVSSVKKGKSAMTSTNTGLPAALAATAAACKVPKFLRSLYAILQTEDPHIISWVENETLTPNCVTAFHILEMERFEREILPKYFKHQKFASFQRQLNNFGFRKWTKTQSSGVCTFSHNCFPPDLSGANNSSMSIRDQWRQKSAQAVAPSTSTANGQPVTRHVAGTGIVKTKAEQPTSASRQCPIHVEVPHHDMSPFDEVYHSPNSNSSMESSVFRYGRNHQPPLKKLARPSIAMKQDTSDSLNGLEGFCEDSFKQFTLPPLLPHRLLVSAGTSSNTAPLASVTSSFLNPNESDFAQASSGFRFSKPQVLNKSGTSSTFADSSFNNSGLKPFDLKHTDLHAHPYSSVANQHNGHNGVADAAALQGAFLEPWMWDAQTTSSNFEIGSFPLEFDCKNEFDWQSASNYESMQESATTSTGMSEKESGYQQDRDVSSNTEEVGLDILLFVE